MESISISTVNDFEGSPSSRLKRKKLSSIACDPCRKLKIRCENGVPSSETADLVSKPCSHCRKVERVCVWPSDRRKRLRSSAEDARGSNPVLFGNHGQGKETPSGTRNYDESRYDVQQRTALQDPSSTSHHPLNAWTQGPFRNTVPQPETDSGSYEDVTEASNDALSTPLADTPRGQLAYTTVQYARHLGATAIAPGHKKISLKVKRSRAGLTEDNFASSSSQPKDGRIQFDQITDGPLSVFDTTTGLPCEKLLPHLLDSFFENYNDNFCFLNRAYLEQLIECGEASEFLICTVSALSARFCPQEVFDKYLHPKADGGKRESWELCLPFLERAKELLMPLLNIPSCDVIAGLLLLSWADFGDNNEAGLWMFTGMSLRMAQEVGLHRQSSFVGTGISSSPAEGGRAAEEYEMPDRRSPTTPVTTETFEESSKVVLFWCIVVQDTCLSSGTGRVPSVKQHEVRVRLPEDRDISIIQAGPGAMPGTIRPRSFPNMVRLMLLYAQSLENLNIDSYNGLGQDAAERACRQERLQRLKREIITSYEVLPSGLRFGAIYYRTAVESGEAGPYLVMHLFFHLQLAFLTQDSFAPMQRAPLETAQSSTNGDVNREASTTRAGTLVTDNRTNDEQYRTAIRSIVDMLTFAKFISSRALLTSFFLNQSFFHAACAYVRDVLILQQRGYDASTAMHQASSFPIPHHSSPSIVFHIEGYDDVSTPQMFTNPGAESTRSYLALIAKTNYQFLRQAIKDMARYYAGAGWVDAVLDQREQGLRDVDLSIVSDSISTFIRLHNLDGRDEPKRRSKQGKHTSADGVNNSEMDAALAAFSTEFPDNGQLEFDPRAFFDEYMSTELANNNGLPEWAQASTSANPAVPSP